MDAFNWIVAAITALIGILGGVCTVGLPVVILVGMGIFLYRRSKQSNAAGETAGSWRGATGTVLASTIQICRTGRSRSEIPVVVYQYEAGGKMFQDKTIRVGEQFLNVRVAGQGDGRPLSGRRERDRLLQSLQPRRVRAGALVHEL